MLQVHIEKPNLFIIQVVLDSEKSNGLTYCQHLPTSTTWTVKPPIWIFEPAFELVKNPAISCEGGLRLYGTYLTHVSTSITSPRCILVSILSLH